MTACTCGRTYAAHSLREAARLVQLSHAQVAHVAMRMQVGIRIAGAWHLTQQELERIKHERPGPGRRRGGYKRLSALK